MLKIFLLLACVAFVHGQISGNVELCSYNASPWEKYNYNKVIGTDVDGTPSTYSLSCDSATWGKPYDGEPGDNNEIFFFTYKLGVALKNVALSFVAFQNDEGVAYAAMALYGPSGNLITKTETLTVEANEDELSWYLWPFPDTNKVLAPGTYTIAIQNTGDNQIQLPYPKTGSVDSFNYKYLTDESEFPSGIAGLDFEDGTQHGPMSIGLVGTKTNGPPISNVCNCTLEVWFDANCTNPANGTEEVVFAGGCSHLKLPHTNYAIATAHDCSGFAIYHGLECFGNTTIQRPNTCFTDMKKSYLLTCPPTHLEYPPYPPMTDMSMEARMERVKRRGPMDSVPME